MIVLWSIVFRVCLLESAVEDWSRQTKCIVWAIEFELVAGEFADD
jgi:hypothetical protein